MFESIYFRIASDIFIERRIIRLVRIANA